MLPELVELDEAIEMEQAVGAAGGGGGEKGREGRDGKYKEEDGYCEAGEEGFTGAYYQKIAPEHCARFFCGGDLPGEAGADDVVEAAENPIDKGHEGGVENRGGHDDVKGIERPIDGVTGKLHDCCLSDVIEEGGDENGGEGDEEIGAEKVGLQGIGDPTDGSQAKGVKSKRRAGK